MNPKHEVGHYRPLLSAIVLGFTASWVANYAGIYGPAAWRGKTLNANER